MTTPRIEKFDAEARALLAAGFTTKAAQGRARELASRCYSEAKELARVTVSYEVMCDVPYETNNFRAKHAAAMLKASPAAADAVALIERAVALYAEIKAAPIAPKAEVKRNDAGEPWMPSDAFNPALKEQFLKQAPALTAEYIRHVRYVFDKYAEQFGGKVPVRPFANERKLTDAQKDQEHTITNLIGRHADIADQKRGWDEGAHWLINEAVLAEKAEKYGLMVALQWFYKTNAKLGALTEATLIEDNGGYVIVAGTKADGSKVSMRQQRVTKWAPVARELFHQFPSHLYVDGKFHTAKQYVKRFTDARAD